MNTLIQKGLGRGSPAPASNGYISLILVPCPVGCKESVSAPKLVVHLLYLPANEMLPSGHVRNSITRVLKVGSRKSEKDMEVKFHGQWQLVGNNAPAH